MGGGGRREEGAEGQPPQLGASRSWRGRKGWAERKGRSGEGGRIRPPPYGSERPDPPPL